MLSLLPSLARCNHGCVAQDITRAARKGAWVTMQVRRINAAYPSFLDWTRFAEDAMSASSSTTMLDTINTDRQIAGECISMYDTTISQWCDDDAAGLATGRSSAADKHAVAIASGGLEHDLGAQIDILRWKKKRMDKICSSSI